MGESTTNQPSRNDDLKKTPLVGLHEALQAKMVPFAGWLMPVQYEGVIQEHLAVRSAVGIFDVSHMGELTVKGTHAVAFLQKVTCNDVSRLASGKAQYSAVLNEQGGVIDDIIVYCVSGTDFLLCVNASNVDAVFSWLQEQASKDISAPQIENVSSHYGQIALQGPKAAETLSEDPELAAGADLAYFSFCTVMWRGEEVLIARTGYTGEDGFEIFVPWDKTSELWSYLSNDLGAVPCGLGSRDTLRLEAGYPLHGHELATDVSALESGLNWIVKLSKGEFIGSTTLQSQKNDGVKQGLIGFTVIDPGIARDGDIVRSADGTQIGVVTSGTKTPTVCKSIGIARVLKEHLVADSPVVIQVRQRTLRATLTKLPFYTSLKRAKIS
jgi:aminomethyltransferase